MPWWGWMVAGAALLGAEMFVLDAQFYLVFLGVASVLVGFIGLSGVDLPIWAQWLTFAALSILTMLAFRQRVYRLIHRRPGHVEERLNLGDRVTVPMRLEAGQSCRVDYRGSSWTARNVGQSALESGEEAVIAQIDGLTLHLRSA